MNKRRTRKLNEGRHKRREEEEKTFQQHEQLPRDGNKRTEKEHIIVVGVLSWVYNNNNVTRTRREHKKSFSANYFHYRRKFSGGKGGMAGWLQIGNELLASMSVIYSWVDESICWNAKNFRYLWRWNCRCGISIWTSNIVSLSQAALKNSRICLYFLRGLRTFFCFDLDILT